MNSVERRMKRIEALMPKPPRKVEVILLGVEETKEEWCARAGLNPEDQDLIFISFKDPREKGQAEE